MATDDMFAHIDMTGTLAETGIGDNYEYGIHIRLEGRDGNALIVSVSEDTLSDLHQAIVHYFIGKGEDRENTDGD